MNRIRLSILDSLRSDPFGIMKLLSNFCGADEHRKLKVSWDELNHCFIKSNVFVSLHDMRELFNYFDSDSSNTFDYPRFIAFLRGDAADTSDSLPKDLIPIVETKQFLTATGECLDNSFLESEKELVAISEVRHADSKFIEFQDKLRDIKYETQSDAAATADTCTTSSGHKRFNSRLHLESSVGDLMVSGAVSTKVPPADRASSRPVSSADSQRLSTPPPRRISHRRISNIAFKSSIAGLLSPDTNENISPQVSSSSSIDADLTGDTSPSTSRNSSVTDAVVATVQTAADKELHGNIFKFSSNFAAEESSKEIRSVGDSSTVTVMSKSTGSDVVPIQSSVAPLSTSDTPNRHSSHTPNISFANHRNLAAKENSAQPERKYAARSLSSLLTDGQQVPSHAPAVTSLSQSRPATGQSTLHLGDDGDGMMKSKQKQGQRAVNEVRVQLMAKGVRGLVTLRRALRSSDLSGSGRLSTEEFHRALSVCQIALTDRRFYELVDWLLMLQSDSLSSLDHETFFQSVLGTISTRRVNSINATFSWLDTLKRDKIVPEELIRRYAASQHPDVTSFRRSADQIRNEFVETFDISATAGRFVARSDFLDYYTIVSATVADDDLFDLILRSVWQVPLYSTIAHRRYHKPTQISWTGKEEDEVSRPVNSYHPSYYGKKPSFTFS